MTDEEVKQACIDIWTNAMALFDAVEARGKDAPIDDMETLMKLTVLLDKTEEMRVYYAHRNIQRMMALGISPDRIMEMAKSPDGQEQLKAFLRERRGG